MSRTLLFLFAFIALLACNRKIHEKSFGGAGFDSQAHLTANSLHKLELQSDSTCISIQIPNAEIKTKGLENRIELKKTVPNISAFRNPNFNHKPFTDSTKIQTQKPAKKGRVWIFPATTFLICVITGLLFLFKGFTWALILFIISATALTLFILLWLAFLILGLAFFGALFLISH